MNNKQLQTSSFNKLMDKIIQLIKCYKAGTDSDPTLFIKLLKPYEQIYFEEIFCSVFQCHWTASSILTISCFLVAGDNLKFRKRNLSTISHHQTPMLLGLTRMLHIILKLFFCYWHSMHHGTPLLFYTENQELPWCQICCTVGSH